MEIEQGGTVRHQVDNNLNTQLTNIVCNREFTLKKAIILINKLADKSTLHQQLFIIYQQIHQSSFLANLLTLFQYFLTESSCFNQQVGQKLRWLILKIFEIRHKIDDMSNIAVEQFQLLNKLLKIINNVIIYLSKISSIMLEQTSDKSPSIQLIDYIIGMQSLGSFKLPISNLFVVNLFLKILEIHPLGSLKSTLSQSIISLLNNIWINKYNYIANQIIQQILLNTYLKCFKFIKNYYQYFCQHLPTIIVNFSTKARLQLLFEVKTCKIEYIRQIICQDQIELQLLSMIVNQYFTTSQQNQKGLLCQIWIDNIFKLLQQQVQININSILLDFSDDLLILMYFKVSQPIDTSQNQTEKKDLLIGIWCSLLINQKMYSLVKNNKSIMINVQVLLFQFLRQILGILPYSIRKDLYKLILTVFTRYHAILLRQKECRDINHTITILIIQRFPQLIKEYMLVKDGKQCINSQNIINLQAYEIDYLSELTKKCLQYTQIGSFLSILQKKVSKIVLKSIIDKNLISLSAILTQNDIIVYTIENDVELHLDKYEDILMQIFYHNLEKYLMLVSNRSIKNRYRPKLLLCLLNLLLNQLENSSNVKLIKISEKMLIFLMQNVDSLYELLQEQNIQKLDFFNALFSLLAKSLYYNIPQTVNYLLITVLLIRKQINIVLEKEVLFLIELIKFSKMYSTQRQYLLSAYISLFLILYGLPTTPSPFYLNSQVSLILKDNTYFINSITQLFSVDFQYISKLISQQKNMNLQYQLFIKKILKKCLNIGLIRHLKFLIHMTGSLHQNQIKFLNTIINQLINSEMQTTDISIQKQEESKKRNTLWKDQQNQQQKEKSKNTKEKADINSMETKLREQDEYDEFIQYREIQGIIMNKGGQQSFRHCQRVHGKVRSIYRVKK